MAIGLFEHFLELDGKTHPVSVWREDSGYLKLSRKRLKARAKPMKNVIHSCADLKEGK